MLRKACEKLRNISRKISRGKSNKASCSFNEQDRQLLQNTNKTVKGLKSEIKSLREKLNLALTETKLKDNICGNIELSGYKFIHVIARRLLEA